MLTYLPLILNWVMCVLHSVQGYSTVLRSLTSGSATFTLELASYQALSSQEQSALLQRRMGLVWSLLCRNSIFYPPVKYFHMYTSVFVWDQLVMANNELAAIWTDCFNCPGTKVQETLLCCHNLVIVEQGCNHKLLVCKFFSCRHL